MLLEKREVGIVKWFDSTKGYGFIESEDGADIFVHYSAIKGEGFRTLTEQQKVEFSLVQGDKGMQAVDVEKLEPDLLEPDLDANLPPIEEYDKIENPE